MKKLDCLFIRLSVDFPFWAQGIKRTDKKVYGAVGFKEHIHAFNALRVRDYVALVPLEKCTLKP